MDILADTGILLRFMEPNDPLCLLVQDAVKVLRGRGDRIVFALQNAAEFWNVSTRPVTARGGMGLSRWERTRGRKGPTRVLPNCASPLYAVFFSIPQMVARSQ